MTDEKLEQILQQALTPKIMNSEIQLQKRVRKNKMRVYIKPAKVAAIILGTILLTGGSVYAAGRYFNILDFAKRSHLEVPDEAQEQIQKDVQPSKDNLSVDAVNDSIIDFTLREALCDSETITIVMEVSAKEPDKYLFIPEDAIPEDKMSNWSTVSEKTAAEYAKENALKIVNIGGGIINREDLGIVEETMDFQSVSNDVMDVYIRCGITQKGKSMDVNCMATARLASSKETGNVAENKEPLTREEKIKQKPYQDNIIRKTQTFTLENLAEFKKVLYMPMENMTTDLTFKIEKAEVIQTNLGTYVDVFFTDTKGADPDNGLFFRILDKNGQTIEIVGGSGIEFLEDGAYKERFVLNKRDMGESIAIEAYDCFTKEVYTQIELKQE